MLLPIILALTIIVVPLIGLFLGWYLRIFGQMLRMIIVYLILVAVIGYFKWGAIQGFMAMKDGMAHAKQTISTTVAKNDDWKSELTAVGSLRAAKGADISGEVAGIVQDINFNSGGDVKEGDLLIQLRADDDIAKLHTLQASQTLAEINIARDRKQFAVKAISQATIDSDVANLAITKAQVAEQQAIVQKKMIRAPFSGHLGIRNVDVGQYLNAGVAIVTLQQLDPIYLDFNLPQQNLAQIAVGQKIAVKSDAYPDKKFEGEISAINPKVDVTTRNVAIRATLPNPDHILLPGMYAMADIAIGDAQKHVTLPQTAITYNPYGNTVYIVRHKDELQAANPEAKDAAAKDEKDASKDAAPKEAPKEPAYRPIGDKDDDLVVEQVFVTVGDTRGDQVQIVKGVKEGDVVVSSGQLKLQNGSAITINNAVEPKNDSDPKPFEQ